MYSNRNVSLGNCLISNSYKPRWHMNSWFQKEKDKLTYQNALATFLVFAADVWGYHFKKCRWSWSLIHNVFFSKFSPLSLWKQHSSYYSVVLNEHISSLKVLKTGLSVCKFCTHLRCLLKIGLSAWKFCIKFRCLLKIALSECRFCIYLKFFLHASSVLNWGACLR